MKNSFIPLRKINDRICQEFGLDIICLLYTSDAADGRLRKRAKAGKPVCARPLIRCYPRSEHLHEAAKRAFDAQGVRKLPTVKVLQAEYTDLLAKKKSAYEDYKRLRKENQELQAVKSNVDTLFRIEEEQQEKKLEQHR